MQFGDFLECSDRRGLYQCTQWLSDYAIVARKSIENETKISPKSANFFSVKSLFDQRQYERLISVVDSATCSDRDILSLFLLACHYCAQKRNLAAQSMTSLNGSGSKSKTAPASIELSKAAHSLLVRSAEEIHSRFSNDSVICYLYAVILNQVPSESTFVAELLVRAVKLAPFNWAAWVELARVPGSAVEASLASFELFRFYKLERQLHLKQHKAALDGLRALNTMSWSYLYELEGRIHHELRDFQSATVAFEKITKNDKFYITGMDEYSNCLFVLERSADLSLLANHWLETNPNAAESNIIAGNFHSLKSEHEKAALFFKRATIVDAANVNAWLLLGHELIELRNPSAAFAAYQEATKRAPRDMRPWYAMGQMFELINQFAFAVFYLNKAAAVDAKDLRVWRALSNCYVKLNRLDESNACVLKIKEIAG